MNKLALLSLCVLALGVSAFGQAKKPAPAKTIKCAVMPSDVVDIAKATKDHLYQDYKGRRYYFCCDSCPAAFKKNPAKYAKAPSTAIPKPKPAS